MDRVSIIRISFRKVTNLHDEFSLTRRPYRVYKGREIFNQLSVPTVAPEFDRLLVQK